MELPATVSFWYFYFIYNEEGKESMRYELPRLFFAALWLRHYANRGWIFPLSIRVQKGAKTNFSLLVLSFGMVFTTLHGCLHGLWFSRVGKGL